MRLPCGRGGIRAMVVRSTCAPKGNTCDGHAFNVRPEGATSPQPRASERSEATPWVWTENRRYAPGGGKSHDRSPSVAAFAPSGGVSRMYRPNPGCRIASLACPGLGAHCPFGACVERLSSCINSFGACIERLSPFDAILAACVQRLPPSISAAPRVS